MATAIRTALEQAKCSLNAGRLDEATPLALVAVAEALERLARAINEANERTVMEPPGIG